MKLKIQNKITKLRWDICGQVILGLSEKHAKSPCLQHKIKHQVQEEIENATN